MTSISNHFATYPILGGDQISSPEPTPEKFICPLTLDIMDEPVMTRWGHNFEKAALLNWLEDHQECPLTRKPLGLSDVASNKSLQALIKGWKIRNGIVEKAANEDEGDYELDTTNDHQEKVLFFVNMKSDHHLMNALHRQNISTGQRVEAAVTKRRGLLWYYQSRRATAA